MKLLEEIDKIIGKTIESVDPVYDEDTITITFTDDTCIRLISDNEIEINQERDLCIEQKLTLGLILKTEYDKAHTERHNADKVIREADERKMLGNLFAKYGEPEDAK